MEKPFESDLGKAIVGLAIISTFIVFYIGISYYGSITAFLGALDNFSDSIANFLSFNWIEPYRNWFILGLIILMAISLIFIARFIFKMIKYILTLIISTISQHLKKRKFIKNKIIQIEILLESEVKNSLQELKSEIETVRELIIVSKSYKRLNCFTKELKERLKTCLKLLELLKKKSMLEALKLEIEVNERTNEELKEQIRIHESYQDARDSIILYKLNANEKTVFKKYGLSEAQVKALKNKGFSELNEYSMFDHNYIRYLIKPKLNHSPTHAFLVWDSQRLLKTIKGITNIKENLTVDADITFMFNNKKYALEIETGNLLEKKKQRDDKVKELNKKYPNRWMFIVSNKNLMPKYQELGFSTQRTRVLENLKKLLKIA